jgi:hypothetical protein
MISQGRSGGPGFYIGYDGGVNFRLGDSWASGGLAYPIDGAWHRLALIVNADTPRSEFYVDGVLLNSVPYALVTGLDGSPTPTRFGRQFGGYFEFFDGSLDNVRIYDTALSPGEIGSIGSNVPEPATGVLTVLSLAALAAARRRFQ